MVYTKEDLERMKISFGFIGFVHVSRTEKDYEDEDRLYCATDGMQIVKVNRYNDFVEECLEKFGGYADYVNNPPEDQSVFNVNKELVQWGPSAFDIFITVLKIKERDGY